jgi:hypothetical protein
MIDFILGQVTFYGNRGLGYILIFLVIIAIFSFDKIIKLVVYLMDKFEERKRNKEEKKNN